jgi:hypothetical protein
MTADKKLRSQNLNRRLREMQDYFNALIPPDASLVNELLKKHRDEVGRESREWSASRTDRGAAKPPVLG